jgi:hypothetical protein
LQTAELQVQNEQLAGTETTPTGITVAKRLVRQFLGTAVLFSTTVSLGTSCVLLAASIVGYLPYSDRPGPGWWGRVHLPSLAEIGVYLGFAPWFAYFCLIFGLGIFLLSLVLGIASTPKWLSRVLGGLISAVAAGLAVAGAGWYLALAEIGPDVALMFGLLYGICLFPRFVYSREKVLPTWLRASSIMIAFAAFAYWLALPFLPHKPIPSISLQVMRITPGTKAFRIKDAEFLGQDIPKQANELELVGDAHGGIGQTGGTNSTLQINVLLIALEPIDREYKLRLPKTGSVVYVLKDHQWIAHPGFSEADARKLLVEPGIDTKYDGGQIKLGDAKSFSSFTWYPTLPKS